MKVYHGTTSYQIPQLLCGWSRNRYGLSVTDTAERAQLYADAQASGAVSTTPHYQPGSAVVEMETRDVTWRRRPADHPSLDVCETEIQTWTITRVTIYNISDYDFDHVVVKVAGHYVNEMEYLRKHLGRRLHIEIV